MFMLAGLMGMMLFGASVFVGIKPSEDSEDEPPPELEEDGAIAAGSGLENRYRPPTSMNVTSIIKNRRAHDTIPKAWLGTLPSQKETEFWSFREKPPVLSGID